jgi:tRNA(Ser,Leu) C12 N-acetylase TAN1
MEYNTTRGPLILPEYGRNVQNMIAHAMEIENRTERNRAAQAIIEVMGQLNPHLRDVEDYRHKLWTHLFVMSNFELDVDSPYEKPKQEVLNEKPQRMVYPSSKIRYGHYGKYTQAILEAAKEVAIPQEKEYLKSTMANFMKKQFLAYNNDTVENHVIAQQLKELSKGELILENPDELVNTNTLLKTMGIGQNQNKRFNKQKNNKNNKNNNKKKFIKK